MNRILIVDDQAQNLQVLAATLSKLEVKTVAATSGKQVLAVAFNNPPDLILLDIMMPEVDGYQVCKELKENELTKDIPIIFITAKTQTEDIVQAFEYGAVDYITKPFNHTELLKRVTLQLQLKKYRDDIKQKNAELEQLNATKDKLFSIIAHDLRGPMGNLRNVLDLLVDSNSDISADERERFLVLLRDTTTQTYYLLENLLSWSLSQRGKINAVMQKFDVNQLLAQSIELLYNSLTNKRICVEAFLSDRIIVHADKNLTDIVIRNLLSNAIKFTPKLGKITLSSKIENNFAYIAISDTGVGIPKEIIAKLFNSNELYTSRGTENEKGSGLGLMLCKEFVERNDGKLWVESVVNQGTTFTFTIPAT